MEQKKKKKKKKRRNSSKKNSSEIASDESGVEIDYKQKQWERSAHSSKKLSPKRNEKT